MLIEHLGKLAEETPLEQIPVFAYELGDMAKMFFYAMKYKELAYLIEAKISLSDMIAQCIFLCGKMDWNFEDVKELGVERFIERVERHERLGE